MNINKILQLNYTFLIFLGTCLSFQVVMAEDNSDTTLFGVPLNSTTISIMREKVIENGGKALDKPNLICQTFKSYTILEGTSTLTLYSTLDGELSGATYLFPSPVNPKKVSEVRQMVESKYGKPNLSKGKEILGKVFHEWDLYDGIKIQIERSWPNTDVKLTYLVPEMNLKRNNELEELHRQEQAALLQKQGNAF